MGKIFFWKIAVLMAVLLIFPGQARALSAVRVQQSLDGAVNYLLAKEREQKKPLMPWSYVALAAAGQKLAGTRVGQSCVQQTSFITQSNLPATTDYCVLVFALIVAGKNPYDYNGQNFVKKIQDAQLPNGKFADNIDGSGQGNNGEQVLINAHVWAVLALYAAGADVPDGIKAKQWLIAQQHADGSFNWLTGEENPDVDSTGAALSALGALGEQRNSPAVQKAVAYLQNVQKEDGGFTSWGIVNPESCSAVIQGLMAVNIDPAGAEMSKQDGNPVAALLSFQLPNGSFAHAKDFGPDEIATQQALIALADIYSGKTLYNRLREKCAPIISMPMPVTREIQFKAGVKEYLGLIDGQRQTKEADVAPFIENGRMYVPVRFLALALGVPEKGILWSPSAQTVTLINHDLTVTLAVGGNVMYINNIAQPQMDVAPVLKDGRVFLPARYVAEAFGYQVQWDELTQTVIVTK